MLVYKLFWDEFSAWYLEMIKPAYQQPIDKVTYEKTIEFFEILMQLLHPFMPFITEEIWHILKDRTEDDCIMISQLPNVGFNGSVISDINIVKEIIVGIRTIRKEKNIPFKDAITLAVKGNHNDLYNSMIIKMGNISNIEKGEVSGISMSYMVGTSEYSVVLNENIDVEAEVKKIESEIEYLKGFLANVMKKLNNEKFVANAKPVIVEMERKKQADAESKIKSLTENLNKLK